MKKYFNNIHGFTLVELMVSIGIFAVMTTLMVVKYGNFNQSVLLTNLSYDVAVTIRMAQAYGLSVKASESTALTGQDKFQIKYGVHFNSNPGSNSQFVLFADNDVDNKYVLGEEVTTFNMKRGATISGVCAGDGTCIPGTGVLDIMFQRPDPDARVYLGGNAGPTYSFAAIEIKGTDGSTRMVTVRENGQISVKN